MNEAEMIIWDVQHGNAIYVKTPNNKHLVFDLGIGDYSGHNEFFSPLMKLWHDYNVRQIDYLMITHPHLDHIDDILNLDYFNVLVLNRPRHLTKEDIFQDIRNKDKSKFEKYFEYHEKFTIDISGTEKDPSINANYGGLNFQFFSSPTLPVVNLNNHSIITILEYVGIKVIIPGDNEFASLDLLMKNEAFKNAIKDCDILIAPHHGRESAYHSEFVLHANPRVTIISDGSICDTSANSKYSANSRGWLVWKKGTSISTERKLLTTNSDGEIYVTFGLSTDPKFYNTLFMRTI